MADIAGTEQAPIIFQGVDVNGDALTNIGGAAKIAGTVEIDGPESKCYFVTVRSIYLPGC